MGARHARPMSKPATELKPLPKPLTEPKDGRFVMHHYLSHNGDFCSVLRYEHRLFNASQPLIEDMCNPMCNPEWLRQTHISCLQNGFSHGKLDDLCNWIYLNTCSFYVTNLDFLTYTREQFGNVRYGFFDCSEIKDINANVVIGTAKFDVLKLSAFHSMTALIMNGCKLNNTDVEQFVSLSLPHLHHLSFARNRIGCNGARDLAKMLMHNVVLKTLELSGNIIGSDGILALIDLINNNTTLTHVTLCCNPFNGLSAYEVAQFQTALYNNVTLDRCCAQPLTTLSCSEFRAQKRQRMLALMVATNRTTVFLGNDLWLRAMRFGMAVL